jgi:hypothetical protein
VATRDEGHSSVSGIVSSRLPLVTNPLPGARHVSEAIDGLFSASPQYNAVPVHRVLGPDGPASDSDVGSPRYQKENS